MGSRREDDAAVQTPAVAGQQVLVAARDIPQGASLAPGDLAVASFPEQSVTPAFIRVDAQPSAQSEYVGAVTRRAFAQGEPITLTSVVQPDGRGFMAAQLEPGYRAVAVEIKSDTAVGGYIQPNDRVDVIVTTHSNGGGSGELVTSDIVLEDVRVLALGDQTQTQASGDKPEPIQADVAVLELTADDARALALADAMGDISLALRGVQAETVSLRGETSRRLGGSGGPRGGGVRVHAFGTVTGEGR
jgi:pilus assembly protein CpaB